MRNRSTGMYGRGDEIWRLTDLLAGARAHRGSAAFVVGEGGVGTSRLAAATSRLADAAGMRVLRGRSSSLGVATPFRPLTEAVVSMLRTVSVRTADLGPYAPILGRLVPEWSSPSPAQHDASPVVLGEGLLRLLRAVGDRTGCLLVLDDLHQADPDTLAVVEYLVDNIDHESLLLVGSVRDGDHTAMTLVRALARRSPCELLHLDRLPRAELALVVADCLDARPDEVPEAVLDAVWSGSSGNPARAEELISTLVGDAVLRPVDGVWHLTDPPGLPSSTSFAGLVERQVALAGSPVRRLLTVAATFGTRFPLPVVGRVTGHADGDLPGLLRSAAAEQLVAADEEAPDWYAFHSDGARDAVLATVHPDERRLLVGRLAAAVADVHPGLPGEWCETVARLQLGVGDRAAAGRRFTEAGRRALAVGAAVSAVALLDEALDVLPLDEAAYAEALDLLVLALAEAGMVERALACAADLDRAVELPPGRRATLHTRLAWAAAVAGRTEAGLAQVGAARALLAPDPPAEHLAPVEIVAAHLVLDEVGAGRRAHAERLARQAATMAETVPLPVVSCQAWQLIGGLMRHRDPPEATACLERARATAVEHGLPLWEVHALIRLGNDDALRHGDLTRLTQARDKANHMGAVTAYYQANASLALYATLGADYAQAMSVTSDVLAVTVRLGLLETSQYVLLTRAVLAGHQGRRDELGAAVDEFRRLGGNLDLHAPRVHGLASAFCALLEEDRARALADLASAARSEQNGSSVYFLSGRHGLHLLVRAVAGEVDRAEVAPLVADPAGSLRWDRQFATAALAVLDGRAGDQRGACATADDALRHAEPYPMGRHLCLRLLGEAAAGDGWADPVPWLRTAEEYFHRCGIPAVARACRALLRRAGARVLQRRDGAGDIPIALRAAGVTVREFQVLDLLRSRPENREIAELLHVSTRTVEQHVRSLLGKTGLRNRVELARLAVDVPRPSTR